MSNKKLIVGLVWKYPLTFCRGLRINFMLHRYLILCFYGLTHLQKNENVPIFSSLWSALGPGVLKNAPCSFHGRHIKMVACWWDYRDAVRRKTPILLFQRTNEFYSSVNVLGQQVPPLLSTPASTFQNEMWEMGQFTAEGCFFLGDTRVKMERRG